MTARALSLLMISALLSAGGPAFAAKDKDSEAPKISHARVSRAPLGKKIVIRADIEDASGVFAPSVLVRPKGASEYDTIDMKQVGSGYEAVIPAEQVTGDLEYLIEAFDEAGNGPAREGSPEAPLAIQVFDPRKAPPPGVTTAPPPPAVVPAGEVQAQQGAKKSGVLGKWWFWALVGVGAAAGVTAVFLATRPSGNDFVNVQVTGPDPVGRL